MEGLATALSRLLDKFPEVIIEDKGASVAVHTRQMSYETYEDVFARADVLAVPWIAEGHARRLEGNAVVEYLPNISGHKGEATRWIVESVERKLSRRAWVAYIGDDITDEDAFRAIDCGIAVLVGLRPTSATHKLDGITDVDRFLRWLAAEGKVRTAS
jgi:trehalose 6-phosphate phosphatase